MIALLIFSVLCAAIASHAHGYPTSANCTWVYIDQPLSHFEKRSDVGFYKQRLCIYRNYWDNDSSKTTSAKPIFFYTGNESPVDEYVNNTGLIWKLAESYSALVVFAEHRYFGESVPTLKGTSNCISYLTAEEALADYATLCSYLRKTYNALDAAIIAFGGSYGGMLASWMRIKYPGAIDGGKL